jgi:hypothetical protein
MSGKQVSALVLCVVLLLLGAYDWLVYAYLGEQATISAFLRELGRRWPFFPYLVAWSMGALFGHLFL